MAAGGPGAGRPGAGGPGAGLGILVPPPAPSASSLEDALRAADPLTRAFVIITPHTFPMRLISRESGRSRDRVSMPSNQR